MLACDTLPAATTLLVLAAQGPGSPLVWLFGSGKGTGAALLFFLLGLLGVGTCLFFRRDKHLWALERPEP